MRILGAVGLSGAAVFLGCATSKSGSPPPGRSGVCNLGLPCWPTPAEWAELGASLEGKLEQTSRLGAGCPNESVSTTCAAALADLKNPFYVQDQVSGTQSVGWLGGWTVAPSAYAVAAENAEDVVAAVKFARSHKLRVVVKGTGHDYLGRSNAPDSLLIWTHPMRKVIMHDAFVARGCPEGRVGIPAVSVEAGARWSEVYKEVTVEHGRYVQGGGCTSVGAAGGFIQGGGFGSWSKKYGIAAAGVLEAEVVTADGSMVVASACQNQDLFWALRGGGGGTFGIVTRMTLLTHALPDRFGSVEGKISAKSDSAFAELIEQFVEFYGRAMNTEHWGEIARVRKSNAIELSLVFQGMTAGEAERVWRPFREWLDQNSRNFTSEVHFFDIPGRKMWDHDYFEKIVPGALRLDDRRDQRSSRFWWKGDQDQVRAYWHSYQSTWIPEDRFTGAGAKSFAKALFDASRHWSVELHFNKGQAGASAAAVERGRETSMNPAVFQAAALAIIASHGDEAPSDPRSLAEAEAKRTEVNAAFEIIHLATPGSGSYVNETDYFEPDWQREFWGENYPKLLAIKIKYDPNGLFSCHHCVGSELLVDASSGNRAARHDREPADVIR